ncbi:MAG TPA: PQQ-dependent sugar dehydrogenase [Burkholderiales bacterium]|nr:PQQ-dependent sugar dehydrogenase [Burkholderiales bacterium]
MKINAGIAAAFMLTAGGIAQAQPAAAPAPSWQQGMTSDQATSTLHPLAGIVTGRPASELPLNKLKVPAGFKVEVFADGIPDARSLAIGDKGTVFVGNRNQSNVYAITNNGGKREVKVILKGLNSPNGVLFHKGTLFIAEPTRILRYDGIESNLDSPPAPKVVIDGLPQQPGHFWKTMAMGPDGKIYFNIGSPGNIVLPGYIQASISRVDPNTGKFEVMATGVRNSVGMDFDPRSKKLWFSSNARDWLGDEGPADILSMVKYKGEEHGYPYCHQGNMADPIYGKLRSCKEFSPPVYKLGPHVAPLGMRFYTGSMFPAEYKNNVFLAQHGSWNRTVKHGYNVIRVVVDPKGQVVKAEPFLEGFLTDEKADPPMWGRPVDVQQMKDGSLLVSDDYNGVVYRVSYSK